MGPVWQNPMQRTVRSAHSRVFMTVYNFNTQYNKKTVPIISLLSYKKSETTYQDVIKDTDHTR